MDGMDAGLRSNLRILLNNIAAPGTCRGCGKPIWWVTHNNGKKAPYTVEGLNHFADCPASAQFKRKVPGNA